MTITKKQNGSELLVELSGRLDTITAPEFNKFLTENLSGIKTLIIDLGKVDYVSSAGLRVLLLAHKTMAEEGQLIIRHVIKDVMDIFTMTGFNEIFTIED
ncbi:MAG: STAS domain-containing protein [Bacilli bacterium]|nr:STAS domain-containing protein [Bacilli bacterium]